MGVTDESNKYLGDAEDLFKQGNKKEALEKMLDSARASGIDLNYLADEYGLKRSEVPVGGTEKISDVMVGAGVFIFFLLWIISLVMWGLYQIDSALPKPGTSGFFASLFYLLVKVVVVLPSAIYMLIYGTSNWGLIAVIIFFCIWYFLNRKASKAE